MRTGHTGLFSLGYDIATACIGCLSRIPLLAVRSSKKMFLPWARMWHLMGLWCENSNRTVRSKFVISRYPSPHTHTPHALYWGCEECVWSFQSNWNKKDRWDSGKPRRQQILFCDIQIKVVISCRQIYVYHTDLLPLKIWLTLTFTFQGHSRSNLTVPLDSRYMVSY